MKRRSLVTVVVLMAVMIISLPMGNLMAVGDITEGEEVTIVGTMNAFDQLIDEDGTVYEIDITDAGNELVEEVGKKVEATGLVEELEGIKTLSVSTYRILE